MLSIIRLIERMFFYVLIFTALGQVPFKDKNIEKHYHDFVNSSGFQEFFWTIAWPVTWSVQKTAALVGIKVIATSEPSKEGSQAR
jgi:hypothetical protein